MESVGEEGTVATSTGRPEIVTQAPVGWFQELHLHLVAVRRWACGQGEMGMEVKPGSSLKQLLARN